MLCTSVSNVKYQGTVITIKAKPWETVSVTPSVLDSLRIFWVPKDLGRFTSPALPSTAHSAGLASLGRLHSLSAAVLGDHVPVEASPLCWGVHCSWGCAFTNGLLASLWGLHTVSSLSPSPSLLQSLGLHYKAASSPVTSLPFFFTVPSRSHFTWPPLYLQNQCLV